MIFFLPFCISFCWCLASQFCRLLNQFYSSPLWFRETAITVSTQIRFFFFCLWVRIQFEFGHSRSLSLSLSLSLSFSCPSLKLNSKQISFKYIQFKSNFTKITFPVSEKIFFLADPTKKPELLSAIESQKHWLSSSSASAIPVVDDENLKKERENARKLFNGNTTGMIQHNNNTTPHHPLKIAFKPSLGPGRGVDLRQPHAPRGSCRGWLCCWFPV